MQQASAASPHSTVTLRTESRRMRVDAVAMSGERSRMSH